MLNLRTTLLRASPLTRVHAILACALLAAVPAAAQDADASTRPKYAFLRQNEDWSGFEGGTDPFDFLKHVALDDDGDTWVSFGGRLESRVEGWSDFAFGVPDDDDTFVVSRVLLHGDLHFGESFRLFAEGKSAQATDRDLPGGRRTLDMDTLALQQLFGELPLSLGEDSRLRLRLGRQMISFGAQRLISPLPWGNTLRTWDGLMVDHFTGPWATSAFFTAFVPVDKTEANTRDDDQLLFGAYARRTPDEGGFGLELYGLGTTRENVNVNGTMGDSERYTFGTRAWTPFGAGFDVETEAAWQGGSIGSSDVRAGFATVELGYTPEDGAWGHRWFLGLDWASGDDGTGGDVGTFDQLFPLGHAFLGYADQIGRQNVIAANLGVSSAPTKKLKLRAAWHTFWLEDRNDAIYNAGGGVLRAPGAFTGSEIGHEIDLRANYAFDRHLGGYLGYSHFFPGQAIEDSGPSSDVDFVYFGLAYSF